MARPEDWAKRIAEVLNEAVADGVELSPVNGEIVVLAWKDRQLHTVCRIVEGDEDSVLGWRVNPA